MAKRVQDVDANRYRPVRQSLVQEVAVGGGGEVAQVVPVPAPAPIVEPSRPTPEAAPVRAVPREEKQSSVAEALDPRQRLTREKRYLLTMEEEDEIEGLVRRLAVELQTPLKLSQLIRASLHNMLRSEAELLHQARFAAARVVRPANGDGPGLKRYEAEIARLLDTACRMSKTRP